MERQPTSYTAYILRCWLEGSTWRYSLEEVGAGRRHGFATLDEFFSFMLARSVLPDEGAHRPVAEVDRTEARHKKRVETKSSSRKSGERGH
jgi:hypothetical protein